MDPTAVEEPHKLYGMAKHWRKKITDNHETDRQQQQQHKQSGEVHSTSISCKKPSKGEPLEGTCVKHPDLGTYVVAPALDGRITCVSSS
jgi:hypothetical protein